MSHRIATKTKITNNEAAMAALKKKGWDFRSAGNSLYIESGPMRGANINLQTGEISGDTDYHNKSTLNLLSQTYGEQLVLQQVAAKGGYIEEQPHVLANGKIRIVAQVSGF